MRMMTLEAEFYLDLTIQRLNKDMKDLIKRNIKNG